MAYIRTGGASSAAPTILTSQTVSPVGSGYATSATVTLDKNYRYVGITASHISFARASDGAPYSVEIATSVSGNTLTLTFTGYGGVNAGINPGATNTVDLICIE